MKIKLEKNLVFSRQPKPIPAAEIRARIKPKKARKRLDMVETDQNLTVPTAGRPDIELVIEQGRPPAVRIKNFKLGQCVMPPDIPVKAVASLGAKSRKFSKPLVSNAFLPDHLDLAPIPPPLPKRLQTPAFHRAVPGKEDKYGNLATTIFPPDNRMVFQNTSYPWSTCGRVDSPLGQGSGVMVGPRHLLTVSHVIQWNSNGSAGWVRFRPAYFAPSAPFGEAWAVLTYFKTKVTGPTIDWYEGMYDYVVCLLDRNIGNWTGWMGSKGYTDSWDGGSYWSHVGYPGDLTGGNRPTFQGSIPLDGVWWEPDSHEAMSHHGDVWPGQSGGPFFGWWSGWPYAVAVQSSQNSSENNASGGQDMVDLVRRARSEHP